MLPAFLLPESEIRECGVSPELDLGEVHEESLLLTVGITHIVERESLDLSIWGSADGEDWGSTPLLTFPRKSYCGVYRMVLDLRPGIVHLRAKWRIKRWRNSDAKPLFGVYISAEALKPKFMAGGA
ncbi:MAG: hypothetical protein M3Z36_12120 [Acidobacteriota bacterium]|nr:hypothetical protein [Acidobacteriota bacterium]